MAKEVATEKENAPKKKKNFSIVIIIFLVLVIVVGGAFSAYMIFIKKPAASGEGTTSEATTHATEQSQTAKVTQNTVNPKYLYEVSAYTYEFKDEFLVNLADEGGKRYLKIKIFLGYETKDKKKMDAELEERKPILRDAINGVLRSKKSTDLSGETGIENLKKEILVRIGSILTEGRPNNVYFSDMVVQ